MSMRIKHLLSAACIVALSLNGNSLSAQQGELPAPTRYTPWERILEKDIPVKKVVWRELDAKDNQRLFAAGTGNTMQLAEILMAGIKNGHMKTYDPKNDRFTDELTYEQLIARINGYAIINKTYDAITGEELNVCVNKANIISAIHQYRIKEHLLTINGRPNTEVKILGIAPVINVTDENGVTTEQPLFWVYYPDSREYFSRYFAPGKNATQTWDEFFENRQFNSTVTRIIEAKRW